MLLKEENQIMIKKKKTHSIEHYIILDIPNWLQASEM